MRRPILPTRTARSGLVVLLLALASTVASGCTLTGPTAAGDRLTKLAGHRIDVVVTADSGRTLVTRKSIPMDGPMTALQALQQVAVVEVNASDHVVAVDGHGGGRTSAFGPQQASWTYRINGIESNVAAAKFALRPGMSLWWDLRRTDVYPHLPVAIGVFPEPLFDGWRDSVRPIQVSYAKGFESAAAELRTLFAKADPEVHQIGDRGITPSKGPEDATPVAQTSVDPNRANLIIGRWEQLKLDPYLADAQFDPRGAGLTVWIEGHDVWRQDPDMDLPQELPQADGVVWATTTDGQPDSPIVFVVTGITDAGVNAAAHALRSGRTQFHLAAAVTTDGKVVP